MSESAPRVIEIAPRSAEAFEVRRGQSVRVIDVAGGQPGDFVAINPENLAERFSQSRTRVEEQATRVTAGHRLWTNTQPPRVMFTITADTCGRHDLLYSPCCRYALEKRFGCERDGCLEHLTAALAAWGIPPQDVPDPLSLFFCVERTTDGKIALGRHDSQAGAVIELRAEMDSVVAISTCSVPLPEKPSTGYRVEIR